MQEADGLGASITSAAMFGVLHFMGGAPIVCYGIHMCGHHNLRVSLFSRGSAVRCLGRAGTPLQHLSEGRRTMQVCLLSYCGPRHHGVLCSFHEGSLSSAAFGATMCQTALACLFSTCNLGCVMLVPVMRSSSWMHHPLRSCYGYSL